MCGISVVLDPSGQPGTWERLCRMHAPIRHRGPDGEGFLSLARGGRLLHREEAEEAAGEAIVLGFAFRRLRILDLSPAADQPMRSADGSAWMVFNGEIYNYRELRAELASQGREFRSSGDSEVLLAAYEAWGERCFERLEGMWAVAIADLRRRRLVLSRDPFGIKPLYWSRTGTALLAASEIKQILAAREERPRANAPLVRRFLAGTRYPCLEETFFADVEPVPPATWCEVPLDHEAPRPQFRPYWDLGSFSARGRGPAYGDAVAGLRARLHEAVLSQSVADVTVGSLLSGGLDSSLLCSLLGPHAREAGRETPTFSFGIRNGTPSLCELPYAEALARAHGLPNYQTGMDAEWVAGHGPQAIRAIEEPPLALPALAQYRTFQLSRERGATVVLDGQGADEVLGGYPYHQRLLLADRLRRGRLREFVRELRAIGRRQRASIARLLGALVLPPLARRVASGPDWLAAGYGRRDDDREQRARADRGHDRSAVNRQLYWDVKWGNVKIVLGYTDKNAMAHSVEARVPYFDRRLVEFAFGLPDHYKVGDGQRKRILRDVARSTVPADIVERPDRIGFGLPERELMRALWPQARSVIADGDLLRSPCFERARARRMLDDYAAGADQHAREVWRLHALALWSQEFDVALA